MAVETLARVDRRSVPRGRFCVNVAGKWAVSLGILATLTGEVLSGGDFASTRQRETGGRQRFHRVIGLDDYLAGACDFRDLCTKEIIKMGQLSDG